MIWNTTEHTGLKSEENYKFICPNFPLLLLVRYFKNQSKLTQHKNQVLFLVLKVFFRNKTQSITCSHVNTFIIFFFSVHPLQSSLLNRLLWHIHLYKYQTSTAITISVIFKQRRSHVYFVVAIVSFLFLIYFRKQYTKLSFSTIFKRWVAPITQIQRFVMVKNSSQHQT